MAQKQKSENERLAFVDSLVIQLPAIFGGSDASHDEMLSAISAYLAFELGSYTDAEFALSLCEFVTETFAIRSEVRKARAKAMN